MAAVKDKKPRLNSNAHSPHKPARAASSLTRTDSASASACIISWDLGKQGEWREELRGALAPTGRPIKRIPALGSRSSCKPEPHRRSPGEDLLLGVPHLGEPSGKGLTSTSGGHPGSEGAGREREGVYFSASARRSSL